MEYIVQVGGELFLFDFRWDYDVVQQHALPVSNGEDLPPGALAHDIKLIAPVNIKAHGCASHRSADSPLLSCGAQERSCVAREAYAGELPMGVGREEIGTTKGARQETVRLPKE